MNLVVGGLPCIALAPCSEHQSCEAIEGFRLMLAVAVMGEGGNSPWLGDRGERWGCSDSQHHLEYGSTIVNYRLCHGTSRSPDINTTFLLGFGPSLQMSCPLAVRHSLLTCSPALVYLSVTVTCGSLRISTGCSA